jgi:molybdate transport system ATP-binding protein
MHCLEFDCRLRLAGGFQLEAAFRAGSGVTALVGPSGSGKTSVLHLIAGLLRPDQGRIAVRGRVLVDTARGIFVPPERRAIGFVFQEYRLFPHLSVADNLRYGMRRTRARRTDYGHLVEILGLGGLLGRMPESLSGGERQRVALGRAILREPDLLLLDEPLSALDQELKGEVSTYLASVIAEYHLPTLLVSHDPASTERLADATMEIRGGKITQPEPPGK